mgnify:CR=1 FL=1
MKTVPNYLRILLATALFFAVFIMPYWYYQLVRIFATVGFAYLTYDEFKKETEFIPFLFGGFALLFFPPLKIYHGKTGWVIVDLIASGILFWQVYKTYKAQSQKDNFEDEDEQ